MNRLLVLAALLSAGCSSMTPAPTTSTTLTAVTPAFGNLFEVTVSAASAEDAKAGCDAAIREVDRVEALLSSWRDDSQLTVLNQSASTAPVAVDPLLFAAIEASLAECARTGGAFDPTVGPLMRAYGLKPSGTPHAATATERAAARALVGVGHVVLDRERRTIAFDMRGVELDLDGINKGVAVDQVVHLLRRRGITDALISAGGSSIASIGPPRSDPPRKIAIAGPNDEVLATVELRDNTVSTAGNWQREQVVDGVKIGHLFDPRTGALVDNDIVSVSVIAPTAAESDVLDTAVAVAGEKLAERLREGRDDLRILVHRR